MQYHVRAPTCSQFVSMQTIELGRGDMLDVRILNDARALLTSPSGLRTTFFVFLEKRHSFCDRQIARAFW